jgi:hypothetical protein
MRQNKYEYDAFISHAVEDKIPIANELCAKLERAGLRIWYSGKELGVGDSIEKTIENGLHRSRYGIVIFSPTYLAKNWTIREFYTLLAKEIEEQKVILPVLYNVTVDELKNKDLLMADRFAVSTERGIDFVVDRLVREIKKAPRVKPQPVWLSKMWAVLTVSLLVNVAFVLKGTVFSQIPAGLNSFPGQVKEASFDQLTLDPAVFGQIEGLFSQLSDCSCDHRQKRSAPARTVSYTTENSAQRAGTNVYSLTPAQSGTISRPSEGRRMTMAVVFQIETSGASGRQVVVPAEEPENDSFLSGNDNDTRVQDLRTASLSQ